MRKFICVIGAAAIAATLSCMSALHAQSTDSTWPMFRHDAQRTGKSDALGAPHVKLAWSYQTGDDIELSSPSLGGTQTVYIGSRDNNFYCISTDQAADTAGLLRWSYETGNYILSSPAVSSDGVEYIGSADRAFYCFDSNGILSWSYVTGSAVLSSPVIRADGTVFVGSDDAHIYSINSDASLSWSYRTLTITYGSPSLGSAGAVYLGSDSNLLYCLTSEGTFNWSYITSEDIETTGAIDSDDTIYIGSMDNNLYSFASAGSLRWSYETGGDIDFGLSPAISGDHVWVGSDDSKLYNLTKEGQLSWIYDTGGLINSSPAIGATDTVYIGSADRRVYSIDSGGGVLWTYTTSGTIYGAPAISDYMVYIGDFDNVLYAFSQPTSTPTPTPTLTPTPTVTFPPGLRVWPNKSSFRAGETLEIWVSFTNTYVDWDGYLVIAGIGKEWSVMSPFTLKRGIHAIVRDAMEIHYNWGPQKVFSTVVPFGVSGNYTIYCATLMAGLKPTIQNACKPLCQLATTTFSVR